MLTFVARTVVVAVELLFSESGSGAAEPIVAVFEISVPDAVPRGTFTTSWNGRFTASANNELREQLIVPPEPTAGVVQVQPAGELSDWKVVPAGRISVSVTVDASLGPELITAIV